MKGKRLWRAAAVALITTMTHSGALATPSEEQVCTADDFLNCLNGVASSVSNGGGLRVSGTDYGELAHERSGAKTEESQASVFGHGSGLAAGGELEELGVGLWASFSYADFESDFAFQGSSLAYNADSQTVLGGIDKLYADRFLLGFAFGYTDVDVNTQFNGGGTENDGYIFAPYVAMLLSDVFSVDLTGGASMLTYDQHRVSPSDGTLTTADFDSDRWFIATNLNAIITRGKWIFGGKFGYLYTEEEQDGYTEIGSGTSSRAGTLRTVDDREIDLSQIAVGIDIAYSLGAVEPYVIAGYYNDLSRDDGEDAGGLPGNFTSV